MRVEIVIESIKMFVYDQDYFITMMVIQENLGEAVSFVKNFDLIDYSDKDTWMITKLHIDSLMIKMFQLNRCDLPKREFNNVDEQMKNHLSLGIFMLSNVNLCQQNRNDLSKKMYFGFDDLKLMDFRHDSKLKDFKSILFPFTFFDANNTSKNYFSSGEQSGEDHDDPKEKYKKANMFFQDDIKTYKMEMFDSYISSDDFMSDIKDLIFCNDNKDDNDSEVEIPEGAKIDRNHFKKIKFGKEKKSNKKVTFNPNARNQQIKIQKEEHDRQNRNIEENRNFDNTDGTNKLEFGVGDKLELDKKSKVQKQEKYMSFWESIKYVMSCGCCCKKKNKA